MFSNRANNFVKHEKSCDGNYSRDKIRGYCQHCHIQFNLEDKPKGWMANHSRWCDKNPHLKEYKNSTISIIAMNQSRRKTGYHNQFEKARALGDPIPKSKMKGIKIGKGKPHSEETKLKISEARKKYLRENPEKHPWKNDDKFISVPCENFKKFLSNRGIIFVEEYNPIEDRNFSVDIAFPKEKIGIEINGNQHYDNEGKLKPYYADRHNLITESGWSLYEFHYSLFFHEESMNKILCSLEGLPGFEPGYPV